MKKDYIVRQQDLKDCGVCSLASIIKYYKGYIPMETLRIDTNTTKEGTNAYNLIKAAKKYGLNGIGKKLNNLEENKILPAIAHLKLSNGLEHFVVIYSFNKKYIKIMDPAKGFIKKSIEEFKKEWTNTLLIFVPYKEIPIIKKNKTTLSILYNILLKERKLLKKLTIYNLIIIILSLILSYYFKVLSSSITNNYISVTIVIMIFFVLLNIIKIYLSYIKNEYTIYLEKNIDLNLITEFIIHIFKLPLNVIKSRTSGEIMTRINELYNVKTLFIELISNILPNITLAIIAIYFLCSTSNILFFILCIIALLYIIIGIISSPILYRKTNDNIEYETEFNSNLVEKIDGIESIKNINKTDYFIDSLSTKYTFFKRNNLSYKKYLNKTLYYKNITYEIGSILITSIGFILIIQNKLTLINLVTFNFIYPFFINPIMDVIDFLPTFYYIKLSIIKITEFYQAEYEKESRLEFINGVIKISNLSYYYNDLKPCIKNISLSIKENEHIHLVGPSGCGKSTICKIINGTLNDYRGNVTINGTNIKDINKQLLKSNIIYVSQNEKIFTDTLINNIELDDKIDENDIKKILNITNINKILDKKELRLNTYLFSDSTNLSGGEKQRILLARALARKPKILILDESLSELDKKSELSILRKLDKYYKDTTIIYISHNKTRYFKRTIEV